MSLRLAPARRQPEGRLRLRSAGFSWCPSWPGPWDSGQSPLRPAKLWCHRSIHRKPLSVESYELVIDQHAGLPQFVEHALVSSLLEAQVHRTRRSETAWQRLPLTTGTHYERRSSPSLGDSASSADRPWGQASCPGASAQVHSHSSCGNFHSAAIQSHMPSKTSGFWVLVD